LEICPENVEKIIKFVMDFESAYKKGFFSKDINNINDIFIRATKYTGAMMLHRLICTKNTNRLDVYLKKSIDLIELAKLLIKSNEILSETLVKINIGDFS
jgi:hypothetical protein